MSTEAHKGKRRTLYLEALAATSAVAAAGAYLLVKPGPPRAGALGGVACSALLGLLAFYLKQWAVERSLKSSLAIVGILFGVRLIALGVGVGLATWLGMGALGFAAGFLSVYFVVQWIEIGYLTGARNRANREGI